jgi:tryptophan synthase beta chain
VGPELTYLRDTGRATYVTVTDDEAVEALRLLTATEGIIPALESAHAVAHAVRLAPRLDRRRIILVNLSGRGDKDMTTVAEHLGVRLT